VIGETIVGPEPEHTSALEKSRTVAAKRKLSWALSALTIF
jgi:hypothetical protein